MKNSPLFLIGGHQRSGTSALAHLLAMATGEKINDDPLWTYQTAIRPIFHDRRSLVRHLRYHVKRVHERILKAPGCTVIAPLIQELFPKTVCIFTVRDPRDNIASILEWRRSRDATSTQNWWDQSWLGIQADSPVEILAQRWVKFHEAALACERGEIVRYEDFCADKAETVRSLCRRLHLQPRHDIAESIDRQFKKDFGDRKIRGPKRWRQELAPQDVETLYRICSPLMERFGYACE